MIQEIAEFAGLLQRKRWSRDRLEDLRCGKLQRLILHAWTNVPYYRRLMDKAGAQPGDIREPSDLLGLPVTTKQDLRDAGKDCLARGHGMLTTLHTSGHSGYPFAVHMSPAEYQTRRLREFRMLIGAGVRPLDRIVLLGPVRTRPKRFHRSLGLYRTEIIPATLPPEEQLRRFRVSRPDVLWAYPTSLRTALYLGQCRLSDFARPRILITSNQVTEPVYRQQLRSELPDMEIADIYGSAEAGRIAAGCRRRDGLHLEDDAIIVEFLRDGLPVQPGEQGSAVVTCLDQLNMPLIRYEQGDLCILRRKPCDCGWATPLIEAPLGRQADMVTLPDGRKVSALVLDVTLRTNIDIVQYRFVQHARNLIELEICFGEPRSGQALDELRRSIEQAVGQGIEFRITVMPGMRFEGTKFKSFVSRL